MYCNALIVIMYQRVGIDSLCRDATDTHSVYNTNGSLEKSVNYRITNICDLFCINHPFTTNFSFEKNSCIDFELSLLIDYTSYHYEIFSVASTEQDFYSD